jgi:hypothetical protein
LRARNLFAQKHVSSQFKKIKVMCGNSDIKIDKFMFPSHLKTLQLYEYGHHINQNDLPNNLHTLKINFYNIEFNNRSFPTNLHTLYLIKYTHTLSANILPANLNTLIYDCHNTFNISTLPANLQKLGLSGRFNSSIQRNDLPNGLKTLIFGNFYNYPIGKNILPQTLVNICFGAAWKWKFDKDVLPQSLKTVTVSHAYKNPEKIIELLPNIEKILVDYMNLKFPKNPIPIKYANVIENIN